jgi:hypothetical protein
MLFCGDEVFRLKHRFIKPGPVAWPVKPDQRHAVLPQVHKRQPDGGRRAGQ